MGRSLVRPAIVITVALAAIVVTPSVSWARDPRELSREAFRRGVEEAHHEHFATARDAFLEAYHLFPHPSILLNLGVARMHTGEYLAAETDLSRFLTDDGGAGPEDLANAHATLEAVRKHLGTLRLRVSPDGARATLDGVALPLTPGVLADVRAVVGPADLRVEASGYAPMNRRVVVTRDEPVVVDVQLERARATAAPASDDARPGDGRMSGTALGWGLLGGGAALAAVGAIAGVEAIALAHDYNTPGLPQYQAPSTKTAGIAWRTSADVLFVAAIGMGVAGTYFLVRPRSSGAEVHAWLGPSAAGLGGRF